MTSVVLERALFMNHLHLMPGPWLFGTRLGIVVRRTLLGIGVVLVPGALIVVPLYLWLRRRVTRVTGLAHLAAGETLAVTLPVRARIRVTRGTVWATTRGSHDDVWLQAGQQHLLPSAGLTVLEAAGTPAIVELLPAKKRTSNSARALRWRPTPQPDVRTGPRACRVRRNGMFCAHV